MSLRNSAAGEAPFVLPGKIVDLPGRGEMFVRHHQHSNPNAPTLLLALTIVATAGDYDQVFRSH